MFFSSYINCGDIFSNDDLYSYVSHLYSYIIDFHDKSLPCISDFCSDISD